MRRATGASADGIERRPSSEAGVERRPTPPDAAAAAAVAAGEKARAQAEAVKEEEVAEESGGAWMTAPVDRRQPLSHRRRARGGFAAQAEEGGEYRAEIARDWDVCSPTSASRTARSVPPTPTECGRARTSQAAHPRRRPGGGAGNGGAGVGAVALQAAVVLAERPPPPRGVDEPFARRELQSRGGGGGEGGRKRPGGAPTAASRRMRRRRRRRRVVPIREELYRNGRVVTQLRRTRVPLLPAFEQPNSTLTERRLGASPRRPDERRRQQNRREGSSEEARELAALQLRPRRAVDAADERGHQAALEELGSLSVWSQGVDHVLRVQLDTPLPHRDEMLGVWHKVVTALEENHRVWCRAASYEVVTQLLRRDELGCTLRDASDGGAGHRRSTRSCAGARSPADAGVGVVDRRPAARRRRRAALQDLCAAVMAASYFRLPRFALALLDALQTPDVLTASIPEWRGISSELDCAPELRDLAEVGMAERPPLDWRQLERRAADALAGATSLYDRGSGVERPSAEAVAEGEAAAALVVLWRRRRGGRGCSGGGTCSAGWSLVAADGLRFPREVDAATLRRLGRLLATRRCSPARCSR